MTMEKLAVSTSTRSSPGSTITTLGELKKRDCKKSMVRMSRSGTMMARRMKRVITVVKTQTPICLPKKLKPSSKTSSIEFKIKTWVCSQKRRVNTSKTKTFNRRQMMVPKSKLKRSHIKMFCEKTSSKTWKSWKSNLISIAIKMMMRTCLRKRLVFLKPKPRSNKDSRTSSKRKLERKKIRTPKTYSLKRRRLKNWVTMMDKSDRKRIRIKR